mmetsp:Transcript_78708/g.122862  ORF Transcript_78708/g.122862 Transcript_78708/m.122862 type:complete len:96 (-) Transcript_78708:40-327(-)
MLTSKVRTFAMPRISLALQLQRWKRIEKLGMRASHHILDDDQPRMARYHLSYHARPLMEKWKNDSRPIDELRKIEHTTPAYSCQSCLVPNRTTCA